MEIKATLLKPCSDEDRLEFIYRYNYEEGYTVEETNSQFEAWGPTEEEKHEWELNKIANLSATKRVLVLALEQLGFDYYTDIEPKILENRQAKLEWDLCTEVKRNNPLVNILGAELGLSTQQIDDLFIAINASPMREE